MAMSTCHVAAHQLWTHVTRIYRHACCVPARGTQGQAGSLLSRGIQPGGVGVGGEVLNHCPVFLMYLHIMGNAV